MRINSNQNALASAFIKQAHTNFMDDCRWNALQTMNEWIIIISASWRTISRLEFKSLSTYSQGNERARFIDITKISHIKSPKEPPLLRTDRKVENKSRDYFFFFFKWLVFGMCGFLFLLCCLYLFGDGFNLEEIGIGTHGLIYVIGIKSILMDENILNFSFATFIQLRIRWLWFRNEQLSIVDSLKVSCYFIWLQRG